MVDHIIQDITTTYAPLSAESQAALLSCITINTSPKNTILVREGQYSDKTFYLIKGCARAYYLNDGRDISDWFAFEGDFISSIRSFFEHVPSPHYIELLEDSLVAELSREDIERLSDKFHDFERLSKEIVINTMLRQQERISSMLFQTAEQKYQSLLAIRPDITQRIPLTHIASYIGITLETLSRIRKTNLI
ncbi:MAG: Crp/Fnr family transcriptional regulator [Bacteroidota bacterium]